MMFGRPVTCLASFTAASVASAPELAKKNVSMPAGRDLGEAVGQRLEQVVAVHVDLGVDEPRRPAPGSPPRRAGWQWPVLVTAMPLEKSRYSVPSVVVTHEPRPVTTSRSVTWNHTSESMCPP